MLPIHISTMKTEINYAWLAPLKKHLTLPSLKTDAQCCKSRREGVSADPWAVNGPRGLVKRPQMLKSMMLACMRDTLVPFNLGHLT